MGTNTYATPAALPGVPDIFVLHRGIAHANEVMAEGGNKRHRSHNRCMGTRKRMVAPATRFASVGCGLMASHLPFVAREICGNVLLRSGEKCWIGTPPPRRSQCRAITALLGLLFSALAGCRSLSDLNAKAREAAD
jgi:hypothetical protein